MKALKVLLVGVLMAIIVAPGALGASSIRPARQRLHPGASHVVDRVEVVLSPRRPVRLSSRPIPATANVELEVLVDHKVVGVAETDELVACGGTNRVAVRVVSRKARGPATIYAISLAGKHSLTVVLSWSS